MAKKSNSNTKDGISIVVSNRRARHDYAVEEEIEAGLELVGSEVKSLRASHASLSDSYAVPEGGQMFLYNMSISSYAFSPGVLGHTEKRKRRLLLNRREIDRLTQRISERGYALIPLDIHFRNNWAKVQLGLAKGKTDVDRRQDIKARETKLEVARAMSDEVKRHRKF